MRLLPFDIFEIHSTLSREEAISRLSSFIEPSKIFGTSRTRPFIGTINDDHFRISRVINYRNSFRPWIIGSISSKSRGASLKAYFFPNPIVLLFIAFWFLGIGRGLIWSIDSVKQGLNGPWFVLIPVGVLLFGYGLVMGGFIFEVNKARKLLTFTLTGN